MDSGPDESFGWVVVAEAGVAYKPTVEGRYMRRVRRTAACGDGEGVPPGLDLFFGGGAERPHSSFKASESAAQFGDIART